MLRAVLGAVVLGLLCASALLWAVLDDAPVVDEQPAMSAQTAERGLRRLAENDPRRLREGERRTLSLRADELQAVLQAIAGRLPATRARSALTGSQWAIGSSTALPASRWLNVELLLGAADGQPRVDALRIGALDLPPALAQRVAAAAAPLLLRQLGFGGSPSVLADALLGVRMTTASITVDYAWSSKMLSEGMRALLPADEAARLAGYHAELGSAVSAQRERRDGDLLPVLQRLFALALARGRQGDAIAEQRSAVLALALFVNGRTPASLIPEAADWPRIPRYTLTLRGREDLAQHYIGSALLGLYAGTQLADAIGLSKEVRDARSGSGFSFTDLLADRAGTRLGEQIAAGRGEVAQRLAAGLAVDDLLPPLSGLAEFMPEAEFRRRYGGVGAPAYSAVITDIDARIGALELYR